MINNNLDALVHELEKQRPSQVALWTFLVIALDDFQVRLDRLEEIERLRSLVCGDPTAERPCGKMIVGNIIPTDIAAVKELGR